MIGWLLLVPVAGLVAAVAVFHPVSPGVAHTVSTVLTVAIVGPPAVVVLGWLAMQAIAEWQYRTDRYVDRDQL